MKIGIIGGGSLGLLWAARLSEHVKVTLLCRTDQQAKTIQQEGVILTTLDGQEKRYEISAEWINESDNSADFDVLFLMVKQPSFEQILPYVASVMHENTHIVAWQNGLGHLEKMENFSFPNRYAVVTTEGARKYASNRVQHTGNGYIRLGRVHSTDNVDPLFTYFLQQVHVEIVTNIEQHIWEKFSINCVINSLTALLEVPNGQLMEVELHSTMMQIIKEISQVADAKGLYLKQEEIYHQVKDVCFKTTKNFSSMLQDIMAKKQTEIASLNGMVVTYGKQCGIDVPMNTSLTELIKAKSMLF
jgi:2-dehydropantoate 2-reductase